jgi:hypothetical protein
MNIYTTDVLRGVETDKEDTKIQQNLKCPIRIIIQDISAMNTITLFKFCVSKQMNNVFIG